MEPIQGAMSQLSDYILEDVKGVPVRNFIVILLENFRVLPQGRLRILQFSQKRRLEIVSQFV